MNYILVLVDLTPTSSISTDQAINLANYKSADLTLCYIAKSSDEANSKELESNLNMYTSKLVESGVKFNIHIGIGDYKKEVSAYVSSNRPDLVIVATHGKKGLKQNWFGSNIYDLVKSLPATVLVMSKFTPASNGGFEKILIPVAAHEDYLLKVEKSCDILAPNGTIIIFNIVKPGTPVSESISKNIIATKDLLLKRGVRFELESLESTKFSTGYSKETLDYIGKNKVDLISIMTQSAENLGQVSPSIDKENILLNEDGVQVLCANN